MTDASRLKSLFLKRTGLGGRDPLAAGQQLSKNCFEDLLGPMSVGAGKRRARRRRAYPEVVEAALHDGQSPANFAQTMGPAQLAKEHRHKLRPAVESSGGLFGPMHPHHVLEIGFRKKSQ